MSSDSLRVLLLDDEASLREPLAKYLRKNHGYIVDTAANGEDALSLLAGGHYDVALVDEVLSEGPSGLDVLREIKAKYPEVEVILFTGWGMDSALEALRAGAYRYFAKPFNNEELALTIRFAAEQARIRQKQQYMAELVRASQGLTQTTVQEEQLALVWDFVQEHLDVSTFFIALYHEETDTIHFPLVYDKGQRISVDAKFLGDDRTKWGLTGYTVKTGQEIFWSNPEQKKEVCQALGIEPLQAGDPCQSCFCLRLQVAGKNIGALSIQSYQPNAFTHILLDAVRALSSHVSVALENSSLFAEAERKAQDVARQAGNLRTLLERLRTLSKVGQALTSTLERDELLSSILNYAVSALPASQRGSIHLYDEQRQVLRLEVYTPQYSHTAVAALKLKPGEGIAGWAFDHEEPLVVNDARLDTRYKRIEHPEVPLHKAMICVPLRIKERMLGVLCLTNVDVSGVFQDDDLVVLSAFANQAAIAIDNARLVREAQEGRAYLQALYEASNQIISPQSPEKVLQNIVDTVCGATDARQAVALLFDERERPRLLASSGVEHVMDISKAVRSDGNSVKVYRSGLPCFISNTAATGQPIPPNPGLLADGIKAAACLPMPLMGRTIGVLWVQFSEVRAFSETERKALQLFANQSAIAYDTARRMRELEQLRRAAEAMARVAEWKEVLREIVKSAREVLEAGYTLTWPYDPVRGVFFPEDLVADNIPEDLLEEFRRIEPETGKTTEQVLARGYVEVEDLSTEQPDFLGESTRVFLAKLGVKAFQGICLDVAGETLGVLYVDYKQARGFGNEDRMILEHFANHAALTLKKARLYDQVNRSREAAQVVARVSTLGNLEETLEAVVHGAREVLHCDIATLYTFDEEAQRFIHAKGVGYRDVNHMRPPEEIKEESSLWRILRLPDKHYHASEDALNDDLLKGEFVRREEVKSALGVQLRFGVQRVGVMFVNYRKPHRLTDDEIKNAVQFADQAVVAIRNAQLHERTKRQAETLEGLYEAGKAITSTLAVDEVLTRIAEQALHTIGADPQEGCFSHIALLDGDKLRFIAGFPLEILGDLRQNVGEIDLEKDARKGIAGLAVITGQPKNEPEVSSEPNWIPLRENINIHSQLSVPLKIGERIIGVLSIEHPKPAAFGEVDVQNVELLASQASIAIENAHRVAQIENMRTAAEDMAHATNVQKILEQIVASARKVMDADAAAIWQYDDLRDSFIQGGLVHSGIPEQLGEVFHWQLPQRGGIAYTILERGIVIAENVNTDDSPYLREENRKSLIQARAHSFLGVALKAGEEKLGVLYVDYGKPHTFGDEECKTVKTFANQAALALKNARFLEHQNRARSASRVVAELTVLGDLNKALESIVSGAKDVLRCDVVTLYTYDQDYKRFGFPPTMIGAKFPEKVLEVGEVLEGSVVARIRDLADIYVAEDAQEDPIVRGAFVEREKIKSSVGVPLKVGDRVVGVMFVNFRSQYHFTEDVLTDIVLFANQAAVAIRNAQMHNEIQKRAEILEALYETGKAVTSTLSLEETLNRVAKEALRLMRGRYDKDCLSHVALLEDGHLSFIAASDANTLRELQRKVNVDITASPRIGIQGRAARTRVSQLVLDVTQDPDYILFSEMTHSQLSVPLILEDNVIGVLSIEHPKTNAFTSDDVRSVELLAAQAAVAIENARQYETLEKTKEALAARTALAWTGMVSSTWRHAITGNAVTIRDQVELLRRDLAKLPPSDSVLKRLATIDRLANLILEKPIAPPLGGEEGVLSVPVNDLIIERTRQLWDSESYRPVSLDLQLNPDNNVTVRGSPEWLRRALDVLIDNAVEATLDQATRRITIATRAVNRLIEIAITDNGKGITEEMRSKLFKEPIKKPRGAKGLGIGLLLARTILQTYGGELRVGSSGAHGTTMIISLPMEV